MEIQMIGWYCIESVSFKYRKIESKYSMQILYDGQSENNLQNSLHFHSIYAILKVEIEL